MASIMKRTKLIAFGMSICFLLIHILMIYIFAQSKITPLVFFNIFSILFYIFMLFVVYKEWFAFYAVAIYLEVAAHMTLAIVLTGWNNDFQITLIGMSVLALYAEYTGRTLKIRYIKMMPACILGMILYIGSYVYLRYHPAPYSLPESLEFILPILWGFVVFVIMLLILQLLVSIAVNSEEQLEYQLSHDKLTGLPNRYYLAQQFEIIQNKKMDCWIAISDIDNFKKINDTYGHNCGDYVLKTIGDIFGQKDVLVCRWGGEEFIFVGHKNKNIDPYEFLDGLRKEVEKYNFSYDDQNFSVTMTFGMSSFENGEGIDDAIRDSDEKLYAGKHSGKNKVVNVMTKSDNPALSYQDPLTKVKNKDAYAKMIESLNWDIQNKTAQFGIIKIKILNVPTINEKYGHDKGNDYLIGACKIICGVFVNSQVFRTGGDDFAVLLTNRDYYDREELFGELINRYNDASANKEAAPWYQYQASCSMNIYTEDDADVDSVLSKD